MNNIDELKNIWQSQNVNLPDLDKLQKQIRRYEKSKKREFIFVTFSMVSTIIFLAFVMLPGFHFFNVLSYIFNTVAMVSFMNLLYKNKLSKENIKVTSNSKTVIEDTIKKLKERKKITSKYIPRYAALLIIGLNLGYIEVLGGMDLSLITRLLIHTGFSLFLVLFFISGIRKNLKKYDEQIKPMVNDLSNLSKKNRV